MNDLTLQERLQTPPSMEPVAAPAEESLDIVEYWRAIAKRRWSILGLTVIVAVIAALVAYSIRPAYRGTATLLIEQGKTKVVSIEEVYSQGLVQREYLQTQVEILKSDELARKTIQKLKLTTHPDFDPRQAEPGLQAKFLAFFVDEPPAATDEGAILKVVTRQFKKNLQVQLVRNSQLAQISFVSHDPELAAKVPNALAETFIESDLDARVAMTQKATEWLRERMGELRGKVDAAEKALQDYRDRERIVDAKGLALSGASRQLEELTKSLVEARAKRAEAEAGYALVQQINAGRSKASYDTIPAVLRHPLVQRMKEQESEAERRLGEAAKRYGPEHPTMIKARAEVDAARENTRRQIEIVVAGLAKEYEVARANEAAVERALGQSKADIQGLNRKEFQLGVLEREVQQNRNLYDMFVNRLKETSAAGDLQSTIARVVDPATVPNMPHAPNKKQIVGISAAVALVLAAMLALLLDRLNNTLNSTSGVEQRLGVPALGVLQLIKGISGAQKKKGFISELAFFNDSQSAFSEAVRTIRTSVLMSALDEPRKVVVVTSSVPEEGKTTVSYNLACALGQVKRVLLIDADMRRPKIAKLIGLDARAPGLADLVAGQAQVSDCVVHQQKAGIHVLPAGTVPPNPLELISSKRFSDVVTKLKEAFDIVIFDSAPLQLVSDSLVLSTFASEVIYVVKADATPYQVAQNGLKRLRRVDAPILGVVLNQLDIEKAEKYYGEYSGYKSYKGYKGYKKHAYHGYGKTYGHQAD
jgi:capsular exopolysaccharide synthesis family protein